MSLPKTCALPKEYLEVQEEEYFVGFPFWERESKYKMLADVPVGTKGNDCIDCEPGSGPGPFIVVYNEGETMGFIYPYVMVIERVEKRSEIMCIESTGSFLFPNMQGKENRQIGKVKVRVGGDAFNFDTSTNLKVVASEYVIQYFSYSEMRNMMRQHCSFNFGSFGSCALPNAEEKIHFDGYFRCERGEREEKEITQS